MQRYSTSILELYYYSDHDSRSHSCSITTHTVTTHRRSTSAYPSVFRLPSLALD